MLEALAPGVSGDEGVGTQGSSQDVNPVVLPLDPIAFRVEGVY